MATVVTQNKIAGQNKAKDIVLLILRIAVGGFLVYGGIPKLIAGTELWNKLGGTMGMFGINFAPTFWGFMAAFAEGVGGLLIVFGFIFRPAVFLALFTMFVAAYMHIFQAKDGNQWAAVTIGVVLLILMFTGPGRFSVDKRKRTRYTA